MLRTFTRRFASSKRSRTAPFALERLEDRSLLANWAVASVGQVQEWANDIAVDSSGNTYLAGQVSGQVQLGAISVGADNTRAAVVAKLDPNGAFAWAKAIEKVGGGFESTASALAVDASGSIYVTGGAFVNKYNADGSLLDSASLGGGDIAVDGNGNVYLTGAVSYSNSDSAAFITKLSPALDHVWTRETSGASRESGFGIALDSAGNPIVTGEFLGTADFNPASGKGNVFSLFSGGRKVSPSPAAFVWKLDAGGNFRWARYFQAANWSGSHGQGIAVDSNDNVYTVGYFSGSVDFDPGAGNLQLANAGNNDAYVSKLNSGGNLVWARSMGGASQDFGHSIALDGVGNVYSTGEFESVQADFNPGPAASTLQSRGELDVFVSKLTSSGDYSWAGQLGGAKSDYGRAIAIHAPARVAVAGFFASGAESDFDPGDGVIPLDSGKSVSGYEALFVSSFSLADPLHAASATTNQEPAPQLTVPQAAAMLDASRARWAAAGVTAPSLGAVEIRIADLGGTTLGLAAGNTIWLDDNGAGWGWFVDTTPHDDREFILPGNQGERNRMDLLTVVMHELGHLLGHEHDEAKVMAETLAAGERRTQLERDRVALVDYIFDQMGGHHADSSLHEQFDLAHGRAKRRR